MTWLFLDFNGCIVDVWEVSYHFILDVITDQCNQGSTMLEKRSPVIYIYIYIQILCQESKYANPSGSKYSTCTVMWIYTNRKLRHWNTPSDHPKVGTINHRTMNHTFDRFSFPGHWGRENVSRIHCMTGPRFYIGKTSYRKISWCLEAERLVQIITSLLNFTGTSAEVLPRCLLNFRAIG